MKAVFGLDLCHLFPQRVWADIPLIESVQVHSSYRLPGHGGSSWLLVTGPSTAAAAGCTPQEEGAVVGTRLQGPQQQSREVMAPRGEEEEGRMNCCATAR